MHKPKCNLIPQNHQIIANHNIYLIFTSAPSSSKHCTTLTLPSIAAKCNAVLESSSPSLIQLLSLVANSFITLKECIYQTYMMGRFFFIHTKLNSVILSKHYVNLPMH